MLTNLGSQPNLSELLGMLSLAKLALLFGLLVAIAAVVQDAAYRRLRARSDLYEIKPPILRQLDGVSRLHHTNPFSRVGHNKHLRHGDALVDAIISRYV